jgi:lantibiotic transport system ATP-binding protein
MADMIATHRLTKYYGRRRAVDSLDLRVPQGSVYGLLGRNGAEFPPPPPKGIEVFA